MKNELRSLLAAIALLGIASFTAHAQTRVGNGNGDGAFALQQLAAQNPGLKPLEVMQKMWEESKGRLVALEPMFLRFGQVVTEEQYLKREMLSLRVVFASLGKWPIGHPNEGLVWADNVWGVRFGQNVHRIGKLVPPRVTHEFWTEETRRGNSAGELRLGLPTDVDQTTVMKIDPGIFGGKYVELRQYNSDVIVGLGYSHYPIGGRDPVASCALAGVTNVPVGEPCSIFYLAPWELR